MNKEFYVAQHIPSGKLLKFDQLCEDGFGIYQPTLNLEHFDLVDNVDRPAIFSVPKLSEYLTVVENTGKFWRSEKKIPTSDIRFLKISIVISEA